MLYIQKRAQPKDLAEKVIEISKSDEWKNADKDNTALLRSFFDQLDKQPIRDALVREQHGLCAYCMRRIEPTERMNIEHYRPIKGNKDVVLDYGNMLGCCKGGSDVTTDESGTLCCDAAKKDQTISIDPRDRVMMANVHYKRDGRLYIYPENSVLQRDIDRVLMLNGKLNEDGSIVHDTATKLVMGRRSTYRDYERLMEALDRKYKGNETRIQSCIRKRIAEIESMEQYPEYAGVMLYFLRRRVRGNEKSGSSQGLS